jgi:hypothetical protein
MPTLQDILHYEIECSILTFSTIALQITRNRASQNGTTTPNIHTH